MGDVLRENLKPSPLIATDSMPPGQFTQFTAIHFVLSVKDNTLKNKDIFISLIDFALYLWYNQVVKSLNGGY